MPRSRFRDRRGRGLRGPLTPREVPLHRTRAGRFDELVLDAVARLERRWRQELQGVEFAVEDVPPFDAVGAAGGGPPGHGSAGDGSLGEAVQSAEPAPGARPTPPVPLARTFPKRGRLRARIVVYRRPLEFRAPEPRDLEALVHAIVVEQVADLLGIEPETVDPRYGRPD